MRCSFCGRSETVFVRAYSGEKLCKRCFPKAIEDRVRAAISEYSMFEFDNKILVAVSGGKDSVGLLHALASIERRFPKASLLAVSIDEGIKGYRDEALRIASENCELLGVEHNILSFDNLFGVTLDEVVQKARKLPSAKRLGTCSYCGVLRRRALDLAAKKLEVDALALGHNLDDIVQTYLLNIVHGDVWRVHDFGVVSIDSDGLFVRRVRPFCLVPEKETAFYAYLKNIKFQSVACPYAGEALRNDARYWLNRLEQRHAGSLFTVLRSFEKIGKAMGQREREFSVCEHCGGPCGANESACMTCKSLKKLGAI